MRIVVSIVEQQQEKKKEVYGLDRTAYVVTDTNPNFVICSSLELEMICAKKANSGTN
jgi:hypothetical protein